MDVAARHGLKMWIADARFDERARGRPNGETEIAAAVADYRNHPAFGGYFVADEPSAAQFGDLAFISERLQAGSDAMVYVNLLPDFVPGGL
ncbi:MAG: hypothetical protein HW394_1120, partial [Acidobacteria bacterium]|nr:hypothetical protein [Acidobacteriota bacterium]